MKAFYKLLIMLLVVSMLTVSLASCDAISGLLGKDDGTSDNNGNDNSNNGTGNNNTDNNEEEELPPLVDYVANVKFDPNSGRNYLETTVKFYIDGDTTHFNVPRSMSETGILKARYLGVNTPESTGQIEPWGKLASSYTRSKLEAATSIIIESNDDKWNADSTGERYLVWVWYKTAEMEDYRNLNLELLQEGLSKSSSFSETCYAETCRAIFNQSLTHKLKIFSSERDPDFYYGGAISVTLKELKMNIEEYANKRVAFEGVVVKEYDNSTIYVEEYDEETGAYFGMQVFYGYNLNYFGKTILAVGNRARIAGSVQYYENGGTWQISDIKYDPYDTESAEEGNETTTTKTMSYGSVALHSTATIKNLTILSVYTTQQGSSKGAMSLTCADENGNVITVRTIVLTDSTTHNQVTASSFPVGSVIDVKGVVDFYEDEYQIKLFSIKDVTFH